MAGDDYQGFQWTEITCGRHFKMLPREIVAREGSDELLPSTWATIGRAAQAVLPVILRHTNEDGLAYPSEGRLAAMSGLTRKTARGAVRELEERGLVSVRIRTSRLGRRCKTYRLTKSAGDGIMLPSIFIDGGLWACLRPAAKSLAMAFRLFAKPRPDLDPEYEMWLAPEDMPDYLKKREADYCNAEPAVLREFAGIGPRVYPDAISSLVDKHFIELDQGRPDYWRVMVWPRKIMMVAYLNSILNGEGW